MTGPLLERMVDQVEQEERTEALAVPLGVHGDVVHVGLVVDEHLTGEPDHDVADPGRPVGPGVALGQLLLEQAAGPWLGEHGPLDGQHGVEVPGPQRGRDHLGAPSGGTRCLVSSSGRSAPVTTEVGRGRSAAPS